MATDPDFWVVWSSDDHAPMAVYQYRHEAVQATAGTTHLTAEPGQWGDLYAAHD